MPLLALLGQEAVRIKDLWIGELFRIPVQVKDVQMALRSRGNSMPRGEPNVFCQVSANEGHWWIQTHTLLDHTIRIAHAVELCRTQWLPIRPVYYRSDLLEHPLLNVLVLTQKEEYVDQTRGRCIVSLEHECVHLLPNSFCINLALGLCRQQCVQHGISSPFGLVAGVGAKA